MNAKTYSLLMRVIAVALAALIAASVVRALPLYVPLLAVMAVLVAAVIIRRQVKEVMSDERNRRIDEKATSASYRIFTILGAAFALVVLMLRNSLPSWAGVAGETVAYSVCGLMLLHLASSRFYSSKL